MSAPAQLAGKDVPVVARLRWASSVTTWIDGYNLTVVSGLLFAIRQSLHTTVFQGTLLIAAVLVGSLIGGLVTGFLADRIGRRTVFAYDLVFFIVFAALSAVAPTYGTLLAARLMLGLAIGAD
jgi:MFS family permease